MRGFKKSRQPVAKLRAAHFSGERRAPHEAIVTVWPLQVNCEQAAEVWLDGVDTGLVTPAKLEIRGTAGDKVHLQLRHQGEVLHKAEIVLDIFMAKEWSSQEE